MRNRITIEFSDPKITVDQLARIVGVLAEDGRKVGVPSVERDEVRKAVTEPGRTRMACVPPIGLNDLLKCFAGAMGEAIDERFGKGEDASWE
ncbi:MAG: hypothetical protein LUC33_00995 [Prevotellaceae bacterium]|nr:hypothetical protein [Prevotellaceae bacterium]